MSSPPVSAEFSALILSFTLGVSLPLIWFTGRWIKAKCDEVQFALGVNSFFSGMNAVLGVGGIMATSDANSSSRFRVSRVESSLNQRLDTLETGLKALTTVVTTFVAEQRAAKQTAEELARERSSGGVAAASFSFGVPAAVRHAADD